jgi:lactoylglutathione lyase
VIKGLNRIDVITLFVEELEPAKAFYEGVFGLEVVWEDDASAVVALGNLMINLLRAERAGMLVEPATVAGPVAGVRLLLTIEVEDVHAICRELEQHEVRLLNGPVDRPWGRRTASFVDPAGHVWEIAQVLTKG